MSGPMLLGLLLIPAAVIVVRSVRPDRGWPWLLTVGAGWALIVGGLIGAALAIAGVPPP